MHKIIKNKLTAWSMTIITSLLIIGTSCSDDAVDETSDNNWNISGNTIVNIKPEYNKLLRNPLQGWNIYTGLGDGLISDFWEQYDHFDSRIGSVKVSDYGTVLYIRGAWSYFNPQEDKYIWDEDNNDIYAKRFRMLVEGAKQRHLKLAFTFVVDSRDKHEFFTPQFVKDAGAKCYETVTGTMKVWSPYPDDPIFQQKYEKFLRAFAAKYNDPDVTEYVSGFGLGKWGETHSLIYSTGDESPKQAVFDWITDLMSSIFTKVPIFINYHRCILSTKDYQNPPDDDSRRLITEAVNKGFSLRHDAFGMKTYYSTWERGIAAKFYGIRPIIEEGGWVESSHGSSIHGDGYANFAEVRKGEFDEGKVAHVNMMDLRYSNSVKTGETHSWFNDGFTYLNEFISEGGYRLYPDKISVPLSANTGSKIKVTHRWSNLGWGYCPNNIPQWNYKYKVAFALLDKNNQKPVYTFVDDTPKISDWLHGNPHTYTSDFSLQGVTPGNYTWAVGIIDSSKGNDVIGINISVHDEGLTSEGWVKLTEVIIN